MANPKYSKKDLIRIRDMLIRDVRSSNISINIVYAADSWDTLTISAVQPDRLAAMGNTAISSDYH